MDFKIKISPKDMCDILVKNRTSYAERMPVGAWLGNLADQKVENETHILAIFNAKVTEYTPEVSYGEMIDLLGNTLYADEFCCDLHYDEADKVWIIEGIETPDSFRRALDTMLCGHERRVLKITVDDVFSKLICGTVDNKSKTIAQWVKQGAEEKIKVLLNMEDLKDATVTMESFLNLMGCARDYRRSDIKRIWGLSNDNDDIDFALDIHGDNINITDMKLPASLNDAIKRVKEEIEEAKTLRSQFSLSEMFNGLMLAKNNVTPRGEKFRAWAKYDEWLAAAVQLLFKQSVLYGSYISKTEGPDLTWEQAMEEFAVKNEYGDKFTVTYSLEDIEKCIDQHGQILSEPRLTIYDIKK